MIEIALFIEQFVFSTFSLIGHDIVPISRRFILIILVDNGISTCLALCSMLILTTSLLSGQSGVSGLIPRTEGRRSCSLEQEDNHEIF